MGIDEIDLPLHLKKTSFKQTGQIVNYPHSEPGAATDISQLPLDQRRAEAHIVPAAVPGHSAAVLKYIVGLIEWTVQAIRSQRCRADHVNGRKSIGGGR